MDNIQEVSLLIEGQVFKANKDTLSEHSDYFRAMFSGNYVEQEQREITIDVVDSDSMNIILRYMDMGLVDLSELSLSTIGDLAEAANFLQITELIKQIKYFLGLQLSLNNWVDTMSIAEKAYYSELEQLCAAFGLYSFKIMKPEHIPSMHKLFWYLSHPYLDAECELDVFNFGLKWILQSETGADALLIILGCLDMTRLTKQDLTEIKELTKEFEYSLAEKVIGCLLKLSTDNELSVTAIATNKTLLCETYTERVYTEVLNLVEKSIKRKLEYTPVVPLWVLGDTGPILAPHYLYTFTKKDGYKQWLEVADKDLWGWNVVSWGATKLAVVCGEHGRGTGKFMKDVKVYDTLTKEWTKHGVQLPARRHGGVTVLGDTLFILGGVGGFRILLDTAIAYDLKERSYRSIAKIPNAIQNPAVCVHKNKVYTAGQRNIYIYDDHGESDTWRTVLKTHIMANCMVSYKEYIYIAQNYFSTLYRFRPDIDTHLEEITTLSHPPASICIIGDKLFAFKAIMLQPDVLAVEEFSPENPKEKPKNVWQTKNTGLIVNEVAGTCSVVTTMPPINPGITDYHKRYLSRYN